MTPPSRAPGRNSPQSEWAIAEGALGKGTSPVGWAAKDQLWARTRDVPSRLLRYDIRSRRTLEERSVAPSELTGVSRIPNIQVTPDGRNVAFDVERTLAKAPPSKSR